MLMSKPWNESHISFKGREEDEEREYGGAGELGSEQGGEGQRRVSILTQPEVARYVYRHGDELLMGCSSCEMIKLGLDELK